MHSTIKLLTLFAAIAFFNNCSKPKTEVEDPGPIPTAAFSFPDSIYLAPCQITFTNSSIDATSFEWDFGDGTPIVTEANPQLSGRLQ